MTVDLDILALAPHATAIQGSGGGVRVEQIGRLAAVHVAGMLTPADYGDIARAVRVAASDRRVGGIVINLDTPGGSVKTLFTATQAIRDARAAKPVAALVTTATSAGYALAAATGDIILIAPDAQVGSIGVVARHVDQSAALERAGLVTTELSRGSGKTAGSPLRPLDDEGRQLFDGMLDAAYSALLADMRASRPALDAQAIGARVFFGSEGLRAKLADAVSTPAEAISAILRKLGD